MEICLRQMVEGAREATGVAVIIDVFRAFSTACYVSANGARSIIPVGDLDDAYRMKALHPEYILMGERDERIQPGFDFGNLPAQIETVNFTDRIVVQTTSAGTQGIPNATRADQVLTRSFVNAKAVVDYLHRTQPSKVSLVAMGTVGKETSAEDTVAIAPGTPHQIHNPHSEPLWVLCCCSPPYSHDDTELLDVS
jgi:2-phosphosulfolactate phosphatase